MHHSLTCVANLIVMPFEILMSPPHKERAKSRAHLLVDGTRHIDKSSLAMKSTCNLIPPKDMAYEVQITDTLPLSSPQGWEGANSTPFLDQSLGVLNMYNRNGNKTCKELDTLSIGRCSCRRNGLVPICMLFVFYLSFNGG